jgi:hypothetical protein
VVYEDVDPLPVGMTKDRTMLCGRFAKIALRCLCAAVIVAAPGGCSSEQDLGEPSGSAGAAGQDASLEGAAAGGNDSGGAGGFGGSEGGRLDAAADADWSAICAAAVPPGQGACLWACGCQRCARVTAECLANTACKAMIDCAVERGCTNDADAGANSCRVKCAEVIAANYTVGGMRAAAVDQCATTSCRLECLTDGAAPDAQVSPDAGEDAPIDEQKKDAPADITATDATEDVGRSDVSADAADAPPDRAATDATEDVATDDATADGTPTDAPSQGQDAAETGGQDAAETGGQDAAGG